MWLQRVAWSGTRADVERRRAKPAGSAGEVSHETWVGRSTNNASIGRILDSFYEIAALAA